MRKQQMLWKGYTLEELRYQLMITRLCRDVELVNARELSEKLLKRSPGLIGGTFSAMRMLKLLHVINDVMYMVKLMRKLCFLFGGKNK